MFLFRRIYVDFFGAYDYSDDWDGFVFHILDEQKTQDDKRISYE